MSYIKPQDLTYHQDKLETLAYLRELATASQGDERIRNSILGKIEALEADINSRVSETVDPDGSVRVRHPSIASVTFNQHLLPKAEQLFGSPVKALAIFDVEIALAEAVVAPDGVIKFEPYETISRFQMSETAMAGMVTNIGGGTSPVTLHEVKGYGVEKYIPDVMCNTAAKMREHLADTLVRTSANFVQFTDKVAQELAKGGKLGINATDSLCREASNLSAGIPSNTAFSLAVLGEFSDGTRLSAQLELEAALRLSQVKENN